MESRKFTREFKLEVVRLIRDRGVSVTQASTNLGVHVSQLRSWVKKFAADPQHAFPGNGQMKPERLEIARLKREVIKLKAEWDILKKAAAKAAPNTVMTFFRCEPLRCQLKCFFSTKIFRRNATLALSLVNICDLSHSSYEKYCASEWDCE
jgi:transposase